MNSIDTYLVSVQDNKELHLLVEELNIHIMNVVEGDARLKGIEKALTEIKAKGRRAHIDMIDVVIKIARTEAVLDALTNVVSGTLIRKGLFKTTSELERELRQSQSYKAMYETAYAETLATNDRIYRMTRRG